ncbi:dihydrofolate reductase family protein [Cryobacterium sp. Y11]|jgi:dihydrofolate reductase|uniref:dihydrofolate reductase family protein n=1 Tax=Cryobacterium sp. Y11 TaxID=2045016 RepID=UPI000CE50D4C|nr:dihydrofolate reductase family protein [Cryobacterium sp. Y11]
MRKLTAGLFMSLDGVVESPNLWQFDSFDEELGVEMSAMMTRVDTVLLGRVGYEQWASYWPNADKDDPFGAFINPVPKFVASRTLTGDLAWQNSTLIPGDVNEFATELKNTAGGEISVVGGISLVRHLLFAGLLDSLTVMMHPVIAGEGRHLFEPTDPVTRLTLQTSLMTSKGNALLTYGMRTS